MFYYAKYSTTADVCVQCINWKYRPMYEPKHCLVSEAWADLHQKKIAWSVAEQNCGCYSLETIFRLSELPTAWMSAVQLVRVITAVKVVKTRKLWAKLVLYGKLLPQLIHASRVLFADTREKTYRFFALACIISLGSAIHSFWRLILRSKHLPAVLFYFVFNRAWATIGIVCRVVQLFL